MELRLEASCGRGGLLEQVPLGRSLWAPGRAGGGPYLPGVLKPPVSHVELQLRQPRALGTPGGHTPGQQEPVPVSTDVEVAGRRGLH